MRPSPRRGSLARSAGGTQKNGSTCRVRIALRSGKGFRPRTHESPCYPGGTEGRERSNQHAERGRLQNATWRFLRKLYRRNPAGLSVYYVQHPTRASRYVHKNLYIIGPRDFVSVRDHRLFTAAHNHPAPQDVVLADSIAGASPGRFWPDRVGAMQHPACGLRRILLPRTPVDKGKVGTLGVAALLGVTSPLSILFRSDLRRSGLACRGRKRPRGRSSSRAADHPFLRLRARLLQDILEGVPGVFEPTL
jgi:hypothetical protein